MQITNKPGLWATQRFMRCLLGSMLIAVLAACGVGGERDPVPAGPEVVTPPVTTTVANLPPIGSFTATPNGLTVIFNASGSRDPDGTILGYQWNFGDGTAVLNTASATVTHVFANSGTFMVNLIVLDSQGTVSSVFSQNITVEPIPVANQAPVASFVAANTDTTAAFNATLSTDADGTITSYAWNFGEPTSNTNTATGNSVTHVYASTGSYVVTLTAKDDGGLTATITQTVVISRLVNKNPIAEIKLNSRDALLISLNAAASIDPDGTITKYAWNFGEPTSASNTATGITTVHGYKFAGNYTVTLTVTDDRGGSSSRQTVVTVITPVAVATGLLNDTGITAAQCYQRGSQTLVACNSAAAIGTVTVSGTTGASFLSFAPQDGMTGRDADPSTNTVIDGALGFSFTKIGASGEVLPTNAQQWNCIKDNVTGLIWEAKFNATNNNSNDLHTVARRLTHYDSTAANQLGAGAAPTQALIDALSNSIGFKNAVNAEALCGATDWRIPESTELLSIFSSDSSSFGQGTFSSNDDLFYLGSGQRQPGETLISASVSAGVSATEFVSYSLGGNRIVSRSDSSLFLRLVRGTPLAITSPRFKALAGEVTDNKTGLVWRACAEGMSFDTGNCFGTPSVFTHEDALIQASQVGNGWRLPNSKELASIVDMSFINLTTRTAAIDSVAFPSTPPRVFWSSTPSGPYAATPTGQVNVVEFDSGRSSILSRTDTQGTNLFMVRLVRDALK
jgi:PKD repeat protein